MNKVNLTRNEILEDFRRVLKEKGKLTIRIYNEFGKYSMTIVKRVDSFNNLKSEVVGKENINNYRIPKEDLIQDVLLVNSKTKKMTKDYYLLNGRYSRKPIERHFGSWNKMLIELDLNVNCLINISKKDLLDDLIRLYEEYDTLSATIVKHHGKYSVEVYQRRFGSFNKAVIQAGLIPNEVRGSESPTARAMIKICSQILGEKPILEATFDWLENPKTKRNLYIDAYFPNSNIAFEYDGPQDFKPIERYGGEDGLKKRKDLDETKNSLLEKHSIKYIRFPYYKSHTREQLILEISSIL